jgi:hypothetical protein
MIPSNNTQILSQQVFTITIFNLTIVPRRNVTSSWQVVLLTLDMCRHTLDSFKSPQVESPKVVIHGVALCLLPRSNWVPSLPKAPPPPPATFNISHLNPNISRHGSLVYDHHSKKKDSVVAKQPSLQYYEFVSRIAQRSRNFNLFCTECSYVLYRLETANSSNHDCTYVSIAWTEAGFAKVF